MFNILQPQLSAFDMFSDVNGKYHDHFFLEYIFTFNFPYLIYMFYNCWYLLFNCVCEYAFMSFNFEGHSLNYVQAYVNLVKGWNSFGYTATFVFYYELSLNFRHSLNNLAGLFTGVDARYFCPTYIYRSISSFNIGFIFSYSS